ncbi:MAG: winged helix-turn-helix domain-containing protein [Kaiparowitsia implicata GSE-PSE-MK54-09C]|nr:winged helix-turn-helix domain-containing protein [Kaiparowitsia implicata GSE-PSE-MK54-09C]
MAIFLALGDEGRFEIFRKVRTQGETTATELSVRKAASTISHHLAKLENAGVLRARRHGKTKRYSVHAANCTRFQPGSRQAPRMPSSAGWVRSCSTYPASPAGEAERSSVPLKPHRQHLSDQEACTWHRA